MFSIHFCQTPSEILQKCLAKGDLSRKLERVCSEKDPAYMSILHINLARSLALRANFLDEYFIEIILEAFTGKQTV